MVNTMKIFEALFGIKKSEIKNTCVLLPILAKSIAGGIGVKKFYKGKLYSSGNSRSFTAIHTGLGPALMGDAVLYLSKTSCQNIILFGSCGLVKKEQDLDVGSLVVPYKCHASESFSDMLLKDKKDWDLFYPTPSLIKSFLKAYKKCNIEKVACATLGSLKLEESYVSLFEEKNIQVVDMECSAFFSASKHIGKNAMAFFYITDIINKKPFYRNISQEERLSLSSSIKSATRILCEFIEKNLKS